jgi:hypothetical protein
VQADGTHVTYSQAVVVAHHGLALVSAALRPLLRWDHEQMMDGVQRGLAERTGQRR